MTPELRFLIYSTIIGALLAAITTVARWVWKRWTTPKPTPTQTGQAITDLADAMIDVSTRSVTAIRAELEAARDDLTRARTLVDEVRAELTEKLNQARAELDEARRELRETKAQRELDHTTIERLQARVAQLVQVLTENNLPVPPEAD